MSVHDSVQFTLLFLCDMSHSGIANFSVVAIIIYITNRCSLFMYTINQCSFLSTLYSWTPNFGVDCKQHWFSVLPKFRYTTNRCSRGSTPLWTPESSVHIEGTPIFTFFTVCFTPRQWLLSWLLKFAEKSPQIWTRLLKQEISHCWIPGEKNLPHKFHAFPPSHKSKMGIVAT
jgi:hypothetical protein